MTTVAITDELKLTTLKHLASGKSLDVVATITKLPRETVLDIGSHHGYPDTEKLAWAADVVEGKINADAAPPERKPERQPAPATARPQHPAQTAGTAPPVPGPLTKPDEIRVLLNTAKGHPSKRIQTAADRVFDQLDRLRELIRDDEEKHAARRQAAAEREAGRAEVKRLEEQLAAARAKLRGKSAAQVPGGQAAAASGQIADAREKAHAALLSNTDLEPLDLTSKDLRAWAVLAGVDCPEAGRLPRRILDAWLAEHPEKATS